MSPAWPVRSRFRCSYDNEGCNEERRDVRISTQKEECGVRRKLYEEKKPNRETRP
jgi:hypothetical protein